MIEILIWCFAVLAGFLGKEVLKKFYFLRLFIQDAPGLIEWQYDGMRKSGIYNVVLRSDRPFKALVGFDLETLFYTSGYDVFWYVKTEDSYSVVISLYLGKKPALFRFLTNLPEARSHIQITSSESDQIETPHVTYPPHWWQKIGIFG